MKRILVLADVALVLAVLCPQAFADAMVPHVSPPPVAVEAAASSASSWSLGWASHYSFQGIDYSDGRPVLQPQASHTMGGFTVGFWGNCDQDRRQFDEIDLSVQKEWAFEKGSGALGYTHLRYPHREWAPTQEVTADLAWDVPLSPSLSMHWDIDQGAGRYWTFGLSKEAKWKSTTAGIGLKLYSQEHYYGLSGIPAVEAGVSFSVPVDGVRLQPSLLHLWTWPNASFRDAAALSPSWVVGVTLSSL